MLMEEVSCNSGAEEFRVIGDTETSGQIFNQPKNYQNSLHDCILHQNTGGWTTPGPVYGSQAPGAPHCLTRGHFSHLSGGQLYLRILHLCTPQICAVLWPEKVLHKRGRPVSRIHDY